MHVVDSTFLRVARRGMAARIIGRPGEVPESG